LQANIAAKRYRTGNAVASRIAFRNEAIALNEVDSLIMKKLFAIGAYLAGGAINVPHRNRFRSPTSSPALQGCNRMASPADRIQGAQR
jgi:DNA-binding transcriptional regulator WhiA